jgi:hypothetical protein
VSRPAVDEDTFNSLCTSMGDETAVRDIVELFRLEIEAALERMRGQVDTDIKAAAAHQLKGSAGFIGAARLSGLCSAYRAAVLKHRLMDADRLYRQIIEACGDVLAWLEGRGWVNGGDRGLPAHG